MPTTMTATRPACPTAGRGGQLHLRFTGRADQRNLSGSGISAEAVAYKYDQAGNLTGLTRYSNTAETTEVAATSYTYDAADQVTGITDKNSGGTTLVSYAYTYDAAGRVTQEVRDWGSGQFNGHACVYLYKQQPVDRRHAHERLLLERELHIRRQRQRNRVPATPRPRTTSRPPRPAIRTPTTTTAT